MLYFQGSSLIFDHDIEAERMQYPEDTNLKFTDEISKYCTSLRHALLCRRYQEFDHENQYMQYQRAIVKDSVRIIVNNGRLGG